MNARRQRELGPFEVIRVVSPRSRRRLRLPKPRPGLIMDAADRLGVDPAQCVLVEVVDSFAEGLARAPILRMDLPQAAPPATASSDPSSGES